MEYRVESENGGNVRKNGVCKGRIIREDRGNFWKFVDRVGKYRKSTVSV